MLSLLSKLPESIKKPLRKVRHKFIKTRVFIERLQYYGIRRYCPVCGKYSRKFRKFGIIPRKDAECVFCRALERHRFSYVFLKKRTDFFDGKPRKMLHIAPEICFSDRFREIHGENYLSADLLSPRAMVQMDITDIQYPDNSFDIIYCSMVLEHVQEDRKAMKELHRVLKPTGWAILIVPISSEYTFEDPNITDPEERLKAFGQEDHVRRYGPDYIDRLQTVGFKVAVTAVNDLVNKREAKKMGLTPASEDIYFCRK